MDISLFLTKLVRPLVYFIKELGSMFVNSEKWWISKADTTKIHLRWLGFNAILLASFISILIQLNNDRIAYDIRMRNDRILMEKKNSFWQFRYLARIEEEIKSYKAMEKNTIKNEQKIKEITE